MRYQHPTCPGGDRPTSLIQALRFGERPLIVPPEVICLYVRTRALSPKGLLLVLVLKCLGSKGSFFFISVQATTKSFAASFTRILVLIPCSCCLPTSLCVVVYEVAILYRCDQGGLVQHVAKVGLAPFWKSRALPSRRFFHYGTRSDPAQPSSAPRLRC